MKASLVTGLTREESLLVDPPRTIEFLGEAMRVYSTPAMVSDVEYVAWRLLREHLDEGENTVGVQLHIEHLAPTPIGQQVTVEVQVTAIDGRRVTLDAVVRDALEVLGRARHTRFVIEVGWYRARLDDKRGRLPGGHA